ncbi:MAG: hypothetical protein V3R99_11085 [Thermoguttaceae bacterium]
MEWPQAQPDLPGCIDIGWGTGNLAVELKIRRHARLPQGVQQRPPRKGVQQRGLRN